MAFGTELFIAGTGGVLCHNLIFIHGEWHVQASAILMLHTATCITLTFLQAFYRDLSWLPALSASLQICGMYLAGLFTSMSVYRLFFHRLCRFPGPVLARVSKFWHVAHCLDSKNHLLLDRLRQQYGDFVRTGRSNSTSHIKELQTVL